MPKYVPEQVTEVTPEYLYRELQRIADALAKAKHYDVTYAEPDKPRTGDTVLADGTEWNPGSGQGIYRYNLSGSWSLVG